MIAAPLAAGISFATPRDYAPAASVLLAALGAGSGMLGLLLVREGFIEAAIVADVASVLFDIFSILKALEVI